MITTANAAIQNVQKPNAVRKNPVRLKVSREAAAPTNVQQKNAKNAVLQADVK